MYLGNALLQLGGEAVRMRVREGAQQNQIKVHPPAAVRVQHLVAKQVCEGLHVLIGALSYVWVCAIINLSLIQLSWLACD